MAQGLSESMDTMNPINLSREMGPALWSVEVTTQGAYFTGTQ